MHHLRRHWPDFGSMMHYRDGGYGLVDVAFFEQQLACAMCRDTADRMHRAGQEARAGDSGAVQH